MEYKVRKKGASLHFVPTRANTRGFDKAIIITVAGIVSMAAYLTENWNTLLRVSISFSGFSLEKAGKSTVAIGIVKKVIRTVKFRAAIRLPMAELLQ